MDRCINHDWLTRDDKSICMSCGAELDRPPVQYSKLHSSGAKPKHSPHKRPKTNVTEILVYRPGRVL